MLRIAILENEENAKNIIFQLGEILRDEDWTFHYFSKISELAKAQLSKEYNIIILQDKFDTPRVTEIFIHPYPERVIVFTTSKEISYEFYDYNQILYVNRNHLENELRNVYPCIKRKMKNDDEYFFSYNHISVPLKIKEIYYIEKENKNLIYHTKKGEFRERKNISDAERYFEKYQFLRIHSSFLVNFQYITKFESDTVYVNQVPLPFARLRRQEIIDKVRKLTK